MAKSSFEFSEELLWRFTIRALDCDGRPRNVPGFQPVRLCHWCTLDAFSQRWGKSSSSRLAGCIGSRSSTSWDSDTEYLTEVDRKEPYALICISCQPTVKSAMQLSHRRVATLRSEPTRPRTSSGVRGRAYRAACRQSRVRRGSRLSGTLPMRDTRGDLVRHHPVKPFATR